MIRHKARTFALSIFVAAGLGLSGCPAPEQGAVFIEGAMPILPTDDCIVDPGNEVFIASGTLDIGFNGPSANQLIIAARVRSALPASVNTQNIIREETQSPN